MRITNTPVVTATLVFCAALLASGSGRAAQGPAGTEDAAERLGWRLALRCNQQDNFYDTVDTAQKLGFKYLAMCSQPMKRSSKRGSREGIGYKMPQELIEEVKQKLQAAGIKAVCFSPPGTAVTIGSRTEIYAHPADYYPKLFKFASELGIEVIEINAPTDANPEHNRLSQIHKLCVEYNIKVALRMPNSLNDWNPDLALAVSKDFSQYIGTCFLADGSVDPSGRIGNADRVKQLEGRLFCVSLQERDARGEGLAWGSPRGTLDVKGILHQLRRQRFSGIICVSDYRGRSCDPKRWEGGAHLYNVDNLRGSKEYFDNACRELLRAPLRERPRQ
jgi:hypothetical protein